MAGEVLIFKGCSPPKQHSGLTGITTQSATTHTIFRWQSNLDFSYTGTYSEVTLPPGTYELEVWVLKELGGRDI